MKKNIKKNDKKDRDFEQIMGINVISTSASSLLARVNDLLTHNTKFYIVTPNPELVLAAQKDQRLKIALNAADLPVPDGVGLNFASKYLTGKPLNIIPGRKLFMELIKMASVKGLKVFLLGGLSSEAEGAAQKLKNLYKKLKIKSEKGPKLDKNAVAVSEVNRRIEKDVVDKINRFAPDLLFVAFQNPKQEIWVHKNLSRLKVGGAMCVGGTFRYISGLSPVPPIWMEKSNLEWLWRLITEPKRIGRIWNAVVVFPLKVLFSS